MAERVCETELYAPVKVLLEGQGYEVKAEIEGADVVACRGDEDAVIVELKATFSLSLFHQAIERQALSDAVYIAVPRRRGRAFSKSLKNNTALCRRLGLGLITVTLRTGFAEVRLDPAPYRPRQSNKKKARLLREFSKRVGDPNTGGTNRRLMTAYRQDALRCLEVLHDSGPSKGAYVAEHALVERATRLMADDHYGWFERVQRGVYAVTPKGKKALGEYASELNKLNA